MRVLVAAAVLSVGVVVAVLLGREPAAAFITETSYRIEEPKCEISDERLTGLSGMAQLNGQTWVVNDRGAVLYRLDDDCRVRQVVSLEDDLKEIDVQLADVESLAAGPDGWLWVADTGGNNEPRTDVTLVGWRSTDEPLQVVTLEYPDGQHDVEAVLVSHDRKAVLVAKTSAEAAAVFESVEAIRDGATVPLTRAGSIILEKPEGSASGSRLVTGGAVSPQGVHVVLRTYTNAWEYDAPDLDVSSALVNGDPRLVPLPESEQGEAITYADGGRSLLTTGEGSPVSLDRVLITRVAVPTS